MYEFYLNNSKYLKQIKDLVHLGLRHFYKNFDLLYIWIRPSLEINSSKDGIQLHLKWQLWTFNLTSSSLHFIETWCSVIPWSELSPSQPTANGSLEILKTLSYSLKIWKIFLRNISYISSDGDKRKRSLKI